MSEVIVNSDEVGILGLQDNRSIGVIPHPLCHFQPPLCHDQLAEESPSFTTRFVRKIILSYNLIVSTNALLLFFKILQLFHSLRMTGEVGYSIILQYLIFKCSYDKIFLSKQGMK